MSTGMTSSTDTVTATVTVKPARVNTWFHALFTRPGLDVDGRGHQLRWGTNTVDITAGDPHNDWHGARSRSITTSVIE